MVRSLGLVGLSFALMSTAALAQMESVGQAPKSPPGMQQPKGGQQPGGMEQLGKHPTREQMDAARTCMDKAGLPKPANGERPQLTDEQKKLADGCFRANGIDHPPPPPGGEAPLPPVMNGEGPKGPPPQGGPGNGAPEGADDDTPLDVD